MLLASVQVHERHRKHAQKDPKLWNSFLEGGKMWRNWYGEQTLTAVRIHSYLGRVEEVNKGIGVLQEHCPRLLPRFILEPFKSNDFVFEYCRGEKEPLRVNPPDRVSVQGDKLILGVSTFVPNVRTSPTAPANERSILSLASRKHSRCSVVFMDEEPVD